MQVVHVAATHKMEIAFLLHSFRRRRPSLELSPLGVVRPTETTAHKGLLNENGIAVINFPSMIAENFGELIDELHYNCCRRVKSCL